MMEISCSVFQVLWSHRAQTAFETERRVGSRVGVFDFTLRMMERGERREECLSIFRV